MFILKSCYISSRIFCFKYDVFHYRISLRYSGWLHYLVMCSCDDSKWSLTNYCMEKNPVKFLIYYTQFLFVLLLPRNYGVKILDLWVLCVYVPQYMPRHLLLVCYAEMDSSVRSKAKEISRCFWCCLVLPILSLSPFSFLKLYFGLKESVLEDSFQLSLLILCFHKESQTVRSHKEFQTRFLKMQTRKFLHSVF